MTLFLFQPTPQFHRSKWMSLSQLHVHCYYWLSLILGCYEEAFSLPTQTRFLVHCTALTQLCLQGKQSPVSPTMRLSGLTAWSGAEHWTSQVYTRLLQFAPAYQPASPPQHRGHMLSSSLPAAVPQQPQCCQTNYYLTMTHTFSYTMLQHPQWIIMTKIVRVNCHQSLACMQANNLLPVHGQACMQPASSMYTRALCRW